MRVIAEEPWGWFLFEDDGKLYLDVLVEHGAVSFNVTAELTAQQAAEFTAKGAASVEGLAHEMRNKALMRQWCIVPLPDDWAGRSLSAVHEWQRRSTK